jgi:hypothetical protein
MLDNTDKFKQFIILVLECFFILLFFGYILPYICDYFIFFLAKNYSNFYNTTFVSKELNSIRFIDIYSYVFKTYIKFI